MFGHVNQTSIDTNTNVTEFLEISDSSRISLIVCNILLISFGILLNICVVVSGFKDVMNIDKVTQMFILNIALTDITIVVVSYCPMFMTLVANKWVLGSDMCFISAHFFQKAPFINEMLMITAVSCYRLWFLKQPQSARRSIKTKCVVWFMVGVLAVSICPSFVSIILQNEAKFDPGTLNCVIYNSRESTYVTYSLTLVFMFLVVPIVIVLFANIAILCIVVKYGCKSGKIPHKMTIITILCVCWTFLLSYVPVLVGLVLRSLHTHLPPWYNILFNQVTSIDIVANPFIYTLTNSNFRLFMIRACRRTADPPRVHDHQITQTNRAATYTRSRNGKSKNGTDRALKESLV